MFVGRRAELDLLTQQLDHVKRTGKGRSVAIRGRRQVGKSRLVQELCDRVALPYCFYTAVKGASSIEAVSYFLSALRDSSLLTSRSRDILPSQPTAGGWGDMLRVLAGVLPDTPSVVVLDELPWIAEGLIPEPQRQRDHQTEYSETVRQPADRVLPLPRDEQQDQRAQQGREEDDREQVVTKHHRARSKTVRNAKSPSSISSA